MWSICSKEVRKMARIISFPGVTAPRCSSCDVEEVEFVCRRCRHRFCCLCGPMLMGTDEICQECYDTLVEIDPLNEEGWL